MMKLQTGDTNQVHGMWDTTLTASIRCTLVWRLAVGQPLRHWHGWNARMLCISTCYPCSAQPPCLDASG